MDRYASPHPLPPDELTDPPRVPIAPPGRLKTAAASGDDYSSSTIPPSLSPSTFPPSSPPSFAPSFAPDLPKD